MKEKIRSNFIKESLLDYEKLANGLKENTTSIVKDLLNETVLETYNKILSEDYEDDDFEVEEVEDTNDSENQDDADTVEDTDTEMDATDSVDDDGEAMDAEPEFGAEEDEDGEGWAEFDKYKISDGEYDFSEAEDDEIVKVYKLLKNDDQVLVNVDGDNVHISDKETGAEYLVDLGNQGSTQEIEDEPMTGEDTMEDEMPIADEMSDENDLEIDNEEDMNESRIFEIALNEYDSNVGYTNNYQSKDVMTSNGVKEPGKNVNDWDAGVPKDTKKPFPGKVKDTSKPFNEQDESLEESEEAIEEGNLSQSRWNDTHANHNRVPAANDDAHRRQGMQKTSKGAKYRAVGSEEGTNESVKKIMTKANEIYKENKELKEALTKFRKVLQEAAVTNVNLGQIVKLISENSTTKAEKQEIITRFGKDAKTVDQSKQLYEAISRELKNNSVTIVEEKQFTTKGSKMINETQIYQSKDLLSSLDLMHRLCK